MRTQETPPTGCPVISVGGTERTIVEHRRARDMSQADLGALMGVTQAWVSRIESGDRRLEQQPRMHMELLLAHLDAEADAARAKVAGTIHTGNAGVLAA